MNRRTFNSVLVYGAALLATLAPPQAAALTLDGLTNIDASKGLKAALQQGVVAAVQMLGRGDGFLGNDRVRIELPSQLKDAEKVLRMLGQGARVDELVTAMNRGAEAAVPLAKDLLFKAVQNMSVVDAKNILSGGDTAVTEFFVRKTRPALTEQFLPVVARATEKVGVAAKYNQLAGQAAELGLLKKEDANLEHYVTAKTLDALFLMISEEEKKIRSDPSAFGSAILARVFGVLR